jgi:hypothetical protein
MPQGDIMKTTSLIACSVLTAMAASIASANPITVKLTGHVTYVQDSGYLGGLVVLGQPVTATYTYDTSTPDVDSFPTSGWYNPTPAQGTSARIVIGATTFETAATSVYEARVITGPPASFSLWSQFNQPLPNGTSVDVISFDFGNYSGGSSASDALPAGAPDLQLYTSRTMRVRGAPWGAMEVRVGIDTAELVPPAIEVFPATGSFLSQQHFDGAVLLPSGAQVASMQASVGGNPVSLNYPGSCQLLTPNLAGRPALLCPNAQAVLASSSGTTRIDWQVTLNDGTVYTTFVDWNLIP